MAFVSALMDGALGAMHTASRAVRTSGVLTSPLASVTSREKVVWDWPDPVDRMIEELV
jgi:hypothetical protein